MKKLMFLLAGVAMLTACDGNGGNKNLQAQNDSLLVALSQRNEELDDIMATFNEIQDGLNKITDAEGRVNLQRNSVEEGSESAKQQIASDIEFITKQMQENKEQIARLQSLLGKSKTQSAQLKKAVERLTQQLAEKQQRIAELQTELAQKNIRIQELDEAVDVLTSSNEALTAENEAKAQTVADQDKSLHSAWYAIGTKSNLKEMKILKNGDVLKSDDFEKDYFTKIDIRLVKEIPLNSKSADILTTHPQGSYELVRDDQKQLTLKVTDPTAFWSISKYLVVKVK